MFLNLCSKGFIGSVGQNFFLSSVSDRIIRQYDLRRTILKMKNLFLNLCHHISFAFCWFSFLFCVMGKFLMNIIAIVVDAELEVR